MSPSPNDRSTRRLPRRAARRTCSQARWCSPAPRARSTCATSICGGPGRLARRGSIRADPTRRSTSRIDHPVVHVAYEDAEAYAAVGRPALPTEAEWETAARGGLDRRRRTPGATSPSGRVSGWPTTGTATSRGARPRIRPHRRRSAASRQRLRALRHGRQRLGVDHRLVRRRPVTVIRAAPPTVTTRASRSSGYRAR